MKAIDFAAAKSHVESHVKRRPSLTFSDAETALLNEALRMAQITLVSEQRRMNKMFPHTNVAERFAVWAEQMADLRARIEASE